MDEVYTQELVVMEWSEEGDEEYEGGDEKEEDETEEKEEVSEKEYRFIISQC